MRVLVDTNVLIRSVQKSHPACRVARRALVSLYRDGHELFLTTQNVAEFWNVCTRPIDVNGLGLSIEGANRYTAQLQRFFGILPDSIPAFDLWRKLVVDHGVVGVKVHDARLVAVMGTSNIQRIVTFNAADFIRFPGIDVMHPSTVRPIEMNPEGTSPAQGAGDETLEAEALPSDPLAE